MARRCPCGGAGRPSPVVATQLQIAWHHQHIEQLQPPQEIDQAGIRPLGADQNRFGVEALDLARSAIAVGGGSPGVTILRGSIPRGSIHRGCCAGLPRLATILGRRLGGRGPRGSGSLASGLRLARLVRRAGGRRRSRLGFKQVQLHPGQLGLLIEHGHQGGKITAAAHDLEQLGLLGLGPFLLPIQSPDLGSDEEHLLAQLLHLLTPFEVVLQPHPLGQHHAGQQQKGQQAP